MPLTEKKDIGARKRPGFNAVPTGTLTDVVWKGRTPFAYRNKKQIGLAWDAIREQYEARLKDEQKAGKNPPELQYQKEQKAEEKRLLKAAVHGTKPLRQREQPKPKTLTVKKLRNFSRA